MAIKSKKPKILKSSRKKTNKSSVSSYKNNLNKEFNLNSFEILEINDISTNNVTKSSNKELDKLLKSEAVSHYYPITKNNLDTKPKISKFKKEFTGPPENNKQLKRSLVSPHLIDLKAINNFTNELTDDELPTTKSIEKKPPKVKHTKIYSKHNLLKKIKNDSGTYFSNFNISYRVKIAINFLFICVLLILPIYSLSLLANLDVMKDKVYIQSAQAITELENAANATFDNNYNQAISNFEDAAINFSEAKEILNDYNNILWKIASYLPITDKKISSAKNILTAGQKISQAAGNLTNLLNNFELNNESLTLTEKISELIINLNEVSDQLILVNSSLNNLDKGLIPESYRNQFLNFQTQLPDLLINLELIQNNLEITNEILAPNDKKKYLVFFQNTNEIRGTGGFLGSFALLTIKNGEITEMEIPGGGPYDLKASLTERVISPKPMHLVSSRWQIWDANWWPDFPTSAQKIIWFYEASGGSTVDGVITINSDILPLLLDLTGNIYLEKYEKIMTPDNVLSTLQYAVEYEYDLDENKPKQIIADLTPILIDKLLKIESDKMSELLNILIGSLKEKDIQMYFSESGLQNKIQDQNWGGAINKTTGDYLMVVNQNIGGGKTDKVINQILNLDSEILEDGSIYNTLTITRNNYGDPNDIFEKTNNVNYVRIYVPQGSELLEISGYQPPEPTAYKPIEADYYEDDLLKKVSGQIYQDEKSGTSINNEFGKTVFGQWLQVGPGDEEILTVKYKLPFKLKASEQKAGIITRIINIFQPKTQELENYNLLIQKQSGSKNIVQGSVNFSNDKKIIWVNGTYNQAISINNNSILYSLPLLTDQSYAVIVE